MPPESQSPGNIERRQKGWRSLCLWRQTFKERKAEKFAWSFRVSKYIKEGKLKEKILENYEKLKKNLRRFSEAFS